MKTIELKELLQEYPLNSFVGTPKVMSINHEQILSDMEKIFSESAKEYLYCVSDLIKHNNEFFSNTVSDFSNYLSRLIGTTCALKETIQISEDITNVFENELNWAQGLAIRSMITILNNIIQELTIIKKQIKGSRFINRLRDKTRLVMWEKIPQIFNILSIMIAVELKHASPKEILSAIGKGIKMVKTC